MTWRGEAVAGIRALASELAAAEPPSWAPFAAFNGILFAIQAANNWGRGESVGGPLRYTPAGGGVLRRLSWVTPGVFLTDVVTTALA